MPNYTRRATEALLTEYVHFRDILTGLMRDRVFKQDDFKWQVQFKFELKNALEVVYKSTFDTGSVRKLDTHKAEIDVYPEDNRSYYLFPLSILGNISQKFR